MRHLRQVEQASDPSQAPGYSSSDAASSQCLSDYHTTLKVNIVVMRKVEDAVALLGLYLNVLSFWRDKRNLEAEDRDVLVWTETASRELNVPTLCPLPVPCSRHVGSLQ